MPRAARPVSLLNVRTADLGHEHVAAHTDRTVDAPHRSDDSIAAKGAEPRQSMLVVGVHEGAVDVEDRGICHGPSLPLRGRAKRCRGGRGYTLRCTQRRPVHAATMLAERVGWAGSITWFRDNVRRLRPQYQPVDPCDLLTWLPGDAAQCDLWFPPMRVPLDDATTVLLRVLVMTCAYSRFTLARVISTRHTQDLLLGMWELLQQLGRVPRRLDRDEAGGNATPTGWASSPAPWPPRCSGCARMTRSLRVWWRAELRVRWRATDARRLIGDWPPPASRPPRPTHRQRTHPPCAGESPVPPRPHRATRHDPGGHRL
jgi:hypothetical protein